MTNQPNESGDAAHGFGFPHPIADRIQDIRELKNEVMREMKPVMDLVESVNESRVVFELEVFGYTVLKLKSKVQPKGS